MKKIPKYKIGDRVIDTNYGRGKPAGTIYGIVEELNPPVVYEVEYDKPLNVSDYDAVEEEDGTKKMKRVRKRLHKLWIAESELLLESDVTKQMNINWITI